MRKNLNHKAQQNALLKKKEFKSELRNLILQLSGEEALSHFNENTLEELYLLRSRGVRLLKSPGLQMKPGTFEKARDVLYELLHNKDETIALKEGVHLNLYEYFNYGITLFAHSLLVENGTKKVSAEMQVIVNAWELLSFEDAHEEGMRRLDKIRAYLTLCFSDLTKQSYFFKPELLDSLNGENGIFYTITVYSNKAETDHAIIEEQKRPIFKVGLPVWNNGVQMEYVFVSKHPKLIPYRPVYIQQHALIRLRERLDGIQDFILQGFVVSSLQNNKWETNSKGEHLIVFELNSCKVGYLVMLEQADKWIVRTFLFLTNNGTPEGEALNRNVKIQKQDKIYLEIDKLSTYLNSDIQSKPELKKIFDEAGCQSLFCVKDFLQTDAFPQKKLSGFISRYLGLR